MLWIFLRTFKHLLLVLLDGKETEKQKQETSKKYTTSPGLLS